mmetsp:Transcript_16477/g.33586  ORF Transcript_16477/g.33586 Transcript_16477/m.33586 type:complete len:227 (-) Transcript_16477:133-813(-)
MRGLRAGHEPLRVGQRREVEVHAVSRQLDVYYGGPYLPVGPDEFLHRPHDVPRRPHLDHSRPSSVRELLVARGALLVPLHEGAPDALPNADAQGQGRRGLEVDSEALGVRLGPYPGRVAHCDGLHPQRGLPPHPAVRLRERRYRPEAESHEVGRLPVAVGPPAGAARPLVTEATPAPVHVKVGVKEGRQVELGGEAAAALGGGVGGDRGGAKDARDAAEGGHCGEP